MTVDEVLSRLSGVRQLRPGQWIARCPSHDDRNPSLSVSECDDGTILLNDFGGCTAFARGAAARFGVASDRRMPGCSDAPRM